MTQIGASETQRHANRRTSQRRSALLRGKLVYENGACTLDCTIRDLSEAGARIEVAAGQTVPKHAYLIVVRDGIAYEVEAKWRKLKQIGLFFVHSVSLDELGSEKFPYLKKLSANDNVFARTTASPDITPEMMRAGIAAYSVWRKERFPSLHCERDLVRSVFTAMQRVMRKDP